VCPFRMELLEVLIYFLITLNAIAYLFLRKKYQYWADRNVVHDKPKWFYGNMKEVGSTQTFRDPFYDLYLKYKNSAPFGGFYLSLRKAAVIFDLELVKNVLIKDFGNFAHRGNYYNESDDPLSAHLFNLDGPKWRKLRTKLTPTFTTGKMKFMFPTVIEVAERFVAKLKEILEDPEMQKDESSIEIRELLARFTTDVIGSCAFGLECNSLEDPNAQFRVMGKKVFTERRHGRLVVAFSMAFPELARKLHIKMVHDSVNDFFLQVVRDTVEMREKDNIQRNDFMNLLMDLRKTNQIEGLTVEEIAAQAFVFFLAGFETSSSTMSFALYELAQHQDIQNKAREEINSVLNAYDGQFTYEAMRDMKYLYQVLQETMRKHSIVSVLLRKAIQDYPVPNSKQVIESGTIVVIPVDAIHRDPDIYPDPEKFDPDRFTPEEIDKRHKMTWLPFGEGQRNCIGNRFGEMQTTIGLAMLLKNFQFTISSQTQIPLEFDKKSFILSSKDGIQLKVETID